MNKKGRKSNPKPIIDNENYSITEIPLNYAIDIKVMKDGSKRHKRVKLVPNQLYVPLDRGVEYAKETAEYYIDLYTNV